jgi:hypothetical protein
MIFEFTKCKGPPPISSSHAISDNISSIYVVATVGNVPKGGDEVRSVYAVMVSRIGRSIKV